MLVPSFWQAADVLSVNMVVALVDNAKSQEMKLTVVRVQNTILAQNSVILRPA